MLLFPVNFCLTAQIIGYMANKNNREKVGFTVVGGINCAKKVGCADRKLELLISQLRFIIKSLVSVGGR
jgi:hypothetical protein